MTGLPAKGAEGDGGGEPPRVGIVTISDRASRGEYEDRGGPALRKLLEERILPPWRGLERLVPDEVPAIEGVLRDLADRERCSLILTTGGTGPSPRDVTPEATVALLERRLPGFGERMRAVSVDRVPTSILSRSEAGTRGRTLIVNLPGSPSALRDCLLAILPAIPHCLELIGAPPLRLADGGGGSPHP